MSARPYLLKADSFHCAGACRAALSYAAWTRSIKHSGLEGMQVFGPSCLPGLCRGHVGPASYQIHRAILGQATASLSCRRQASSSGLCFLASGSRPIEALCRHSGSNVCNPWADSRMWRRHRIIIELQSPGRKLPKASVLPGRRPSACCRLPGRT